MFQFVFIGFFSSMTFSSASGSQNLLFPYFVVSSATSLVLSNSLSSSSLISQPHIGPTHSL
jgi:hypothetical protein